MDIIYRNVQQILSELPPGVQLVAAGKGRTVAQIREAAAAGVKIIGENYLQEAMKAQPAVGTRVQWHFIGHLQKNKVKNAVGIFDMIETVDSPELAGEIDKRCRYLGKVMPVLVEVNSGREPNKSGLLAEEVAAFIRKIAPLPNIRVQGLMTMGPVTPEITDIRPCFKLVRELFEEIRLIGINGIEMKYLSMGMSETYRIAIEEGANIVRIGRGIFG